MENLFDVLCSAVSERSIKKLFCDAEGPDLMILMIKWAPTSFHLYKLLIFDRENSKSKSRCIKLLDYAMSGPDGAPVCEAFVEALGLKTIFMAFMGKVRVFYQQILLTLHHTTHRPPNVQNLPQQLQHQKMLPTASASFLRY
jgi:hypothetical protein